MKVDLIARRWGGVDGAPDGMAMAAAYLAFTLAELGHEVRALFGAEGAPAWTHPRIEWKRLDHPHVPPDFNADLTISTVQPQWRRLAIAAQRAGATGRTAFWHHHGALPQGHGCRLLGLNQAATTGAEGWSSIGILPPSSWVAEAGGSCTGDAILVPGAGAAKGGYIARAVAKMCPDLRWYVLPGRHAQHDLLEWESMPNAEIAPGRVPPTTFLARARAVLSPTREEVHPLTLVEAAARGIPIVTTDLPATRAACGESAVYVPLNWTLFTWALALKKALASPLPRLQLLPYRQVVGDALTLLVRAKEAAA